MARIATSDGPMCPQESTAGKDIFWVGTSNEKDDRPVDCLVGSRSWIVDDAQMDAFDGTEWVPQFKLGVDA